MRHSPVLCILSLLLWLTACSKPDADRWRIGDFGSTDPDKLIVYSIDSDDDRIKERIRSYLNAKVPETPAGIAAHQFVEWWDSDHGSEAQAQRIATLQRCVDANPKYTPCLYLLGSLGSDLKGGVAEAAKALERVLELDPNFHLRQVFVDLHQKLLFDLKDPKRAQALLDQYKGSYPNSYVWDYDKALTECREQHYDACLGFLNAAKAKPDAPFTVLRQIGVLKTDPARLYNPEKDGPPIEIGRSIVIEAFGNPSLSAFGKREAISWFLDSFAFTSQVADTPGYDLAYTEAESRHAQNTYQYAQLILKDGRADRARDKAAKAFSDTPSATPNELLALGIARLHVEGASHAVLDFLHRGLTSQYTEASRRDALRQTMQGMILMGLNGDAEKLLADIRKEYPAGKADYIDDYSVYLANHDYKEAYTALQKYPSRNQYFRADFERLMRMSQAQSSREQFKKDHAFLISWYQTFDEQQDAKFSFESGSAELADGASADLQKLALLLSSPAASPYLFEVTGHTDAHETSTGSTTLSELRANTLRDALIKKGVSPERLVTQGYESKLPRATNSTEDGRRLNRRVEIRPIDNLARPRIAEKLPLPTTDFMLPLSGGRWAIMGQNPAYRVDLLTGTRVATFNEGTPKALLHHERYLLTQFWHKGPDGISRAGLVLYDVMTGEMIARRELYGCDSCSQVAISPGQDEIAYNQGVSLAVLDGETLTIKRSGVVGRKLNPWSKGIVWTADGKIVMSFANYDRMYVIDAKTMKVEHEITGISWIHSLVLSGSGRYLAGGDAGGKIHVWDTKSWAELGTLDSELSYPDFMVARQGSDEIAVGGKARASKRMDLAGMRIIETWSNGDTPNNALAYSQDGETLYRRNASGWHGENLASQETWNMPTETDKDGIVQTWAFPDSGRLLIRSRLGGQYRMEIFNVKDLSRVYDLTPYVRGNGSYDVNPDGAIQILDRSAGKWLTFDTNTLTFSDQRALGDAELAAKLKSPPQDTPYFVRMSSKTLIAFWNGRKKGNPETTLHGAIYDRDGRFKTRFDLDLVTEALKRGAYAAGFSNELSSTGRFLAIWPDWIDGADTGSVKSRRVYIVDTQSGAVVQKIERSGRPVGMAFSGETFKLKYGSSVQSFELPRGRETSAEYGDESTLDLKGGERLIYRARGNFFTQRPPTIIDNFIDVGDRLTDSVSYFPDLNLVVDLADGLLEFRDSQSLNTRYKLRVRGPGEWIAYTDDGHFVASPHGTDGLYWNVGEKFLPFESLRQRFENAGLLRQATGSAAPQPGTAAVADANASTPRADSLAIESDVFPPPYSLSIAGDAHRSTVQTSEKITIAVTKTRQTSQPYQLEITLNGRVLDSETAARGLSRIEVPCDNSAASCASQHVFNADLQDGLNVVQVCLVIRDVRVDPHTVIIEKTKMAAQGRIEVASLPQLWFFGVGVSNYADKNLSLQYPRADATAIAAAFKSQEGRVYSKVNVDTLLDDQATANSVRVEMHRFLKEATQQDVVVVFLAGHGAMDESQTLYFITYDAKWDEPYSGMNVAEVNEVLGKRPAGQKAIVMLDICHAGAGTAVHTRGSPPGSDEAIKLLGSGSGIAVIMASTARELSEEGPQFGGGHGAFSWALVEGLKGAAADGSYVTVTSLEHYVERRVQEITSNNQHPTSSSDQFHDYPVAALH